MFCKLLFNVRILRRRWRRRRKKNIILISSMLDFHFGFRDRYFGDGDDALMNAGRQAGIVRASALGTLGHVHAFFVVAHFCFFLSNFFAPLSMINFQTLCFALVCSTRKFSRRTFHSTFKHNNNILLVSENYRFSLIVFLIKLLKSINHFIVSSRNQGKFCRRGRTELIELPNPNRCLDAI